MSENVKKEKWYFIDEMNSTEVDYNSKKVRLLMFIIPFIIGIIVGIIYYNAHTDKLEYEINSYSSENFNKLDEVFNIFITEGSRFDLTYIPEDVESYNVEYNNNEIKLHYSLKCDEHFDYAPTLYMDVTLSKDLNILEKSKNYESQEEYIKITKSSLRIICTLIALFASAITSFSYIIAMLIGMIISYIHKRIDLSKETKKEETEG